MAWLMCFKEPLPFRRYVPSGKFAGPTVKPFRAFLEVGSEPASPSSCFRFVPMVESLNKVNQHNRQVEAQKLLSRPLIFDKSIFCAKKITFCGGKVMGAKMALVQLMQALYAP